MNALEWARSSGIRRRLPLVLLPAAIILTCAGCRKPAGCTPAPPSEAERTPAPPSQTELKEWVSRAASIPAREFHVRATAARRAEPMPLPGNQPLTLAVLASFGGRGQLADKDFRSLAPPLGRPEMLAKAICPRLDLTAEPPAADSTEYASIIRPEYVTACESQIKGDTLTGKVSFRAQGVYEGTVEFTAKPHSDGWRVVEFRFPVSGHRTALTHLGTWISTLRAMPERDLKVELPKAATRPRPLSAAPPQLIINIRRDGRVVVAGRLFADRESLRKMLAVVAKRDPARQVLVRCDAAAAHRHLAEVLGICGQVGIRDARIGLVRPEATSQPSTQGTR